MKHTNTVIVGTGVVGLLVLITGFSMGWYGFPAIIVHYVKNDVLLVNGTEAYERWRKLPVALYYKLYLFNVTNPDEVQNNGSDPIVQEVGPYVYDLYKEKFDIEAEGDNSFSYLQNSTYYFNKEKSGDLSEDDVVTLLNIALLGSALKVKKELNPFLSKMNPIVKEIFPSSDSIFLTATVKEHFWDGVTVVDCTRNLSSSANLVCGMLGALLPVTIAEQSPGIYKLAYFRNKNNSHEGRFRVNSGISDSRALGRIEEFNKEPKLEKWAGNFCNVINGTDSTIYPPFWTSKDELYIFVTDVCRSLAAQFEAEMTWKGLPVLHFVGSTHNFEDAEEYPPNICFCEEGDPSTCLKSGVLDLSPCYGVPLIASLPHFYNTSPDYQSYVQGLEPDKIKHETFVDIEPKTGVGVRGSKRIQLNMFLTKIQDLTMLANVSEGLFPTVWIDEGVEITDKFLAKIEEVYTATRAFSILKWVIIAAGVLLMCVSICIFVFAIKRNSDNNVLQIEDNNRVMVSYDNKAYMHKPESINDTLSITAINDIINNDQNSIKKRRGDRFPGKMHTRFEHNRTNDSVGLGVQKDTNSAVTLSNVFM